MVNRVFSSPKRILSALPPFDDLPSGSMLATYRVRHHGASPHEVLGRPLAELAYRVVGDGAMLLGPFIGLSPSFDPLFSSFFGYVARARAPRSRPDGPVSPLYLEAAAMAAGKGWQAMPSR